MANYKVVYRDENPAWQIGCPLRIEVLQVARDTETQRAFLQLKIRNVSNGSIGAVEVSAKVSSPGGQVEEVVFSDLDADIAPNMEWTPRAHELEHPEVGNVYASVTRAGNVASFGPAEKLPAQEPLLLSPEAARARDAELAERQLDPSKLKRRLHEGEGWWICSCGSLNVGRNACRSCGAQKELLSQLEDEPWLEERDRVLRYKGASAALASGKADQLDWAKTQFEWLGGYRDSEEMAEKCAAAAQQVEQSRRKTARLAGIAAAVVALVVAAFFIATRVVIPMNRYNDAVALMELGDFDGAAAAFMELGNYRDSQAKVAECQDASRYNDAVSLMESGDYRAAYEAFESTSYLDAADLRRQCANKLGKAEEEAGNLYEALEWYEAAENQDAYDIAAKSLTDLILASRNRLSAGSGHTVGLLSDGTVVATGINDDGQCNVSGWTDIVAISAGNAYTIGLRSDGTVIATGSNLYGQCDVSGWTDIVAVSAGNYHTVGLKSDGTVVATGYDYQGSCDVSDWTDIVAISAGDHHTVGIRSDGTVVATGSDAEGQCDVSGWSEIVAVSAGGWATVGLRSDGTVIIAGSQRTGAGYVSDWVGRFSAVSSGISHTVGIRSDGRVFAAGGSDYGMSDVSGWTDIVAISAGSGHTVGMRSDGTVVATGSNQNGQCDVSDWDLIL